MRREHQVLLSSVGAAVRRLREEREFSRRELAQKSGVSQRFLADLEGGQGNISVARLSLPPNSLSHTPIQILFPLITKGDDFSVVVETSSANTYVYGSVIENATSEARFIAPAIGATDAQYGILVTHE